MPVYLGEKAPDFSANTTAGPITLSQFKGICEIGKKNFC